MARQQARRRNRERLTGIILAVLGIVVLVVAAIALAAPDGNEGTAASRSSSAAATTSGAASSTTPPATSSTAGGSMPSTQPGPSLSLGSSSQSSSSARKLPLVVLNNTNTNGLATEAARSFREGGWKVDEVSNLSNEIVSTCAYYDPDVDGAEAAAKALRRQFPAIKRVVEKFSELPSGPIVVVLTSDYSAN